MDQSIVNEDEFSSMYCSGGRIAQASPQRSIDPNHPLIDHLKLKSFAATTSFSQEDACSPDFMDVVCGRLQSRLTVLRVLDHFGRSGLVDAVTSARTSQPVQLPRFLIHLVGRPPPIHVCPVSE